MFPAISQSPTFVLEAFLYAIAGGVLPALLWLWFWLHEEHKHHESHSTISMTFVFGMIAVFLVYPVQQLVTYFGVPEGSNWSLFLWALIEEVAKFLVAYFIALRTTKVFDEPIDAFVYLVTAALGFAAMENTLFLLAPLLSGDTVTTVLTGNLRFMGASLLHVISSGALSLFIAFAYYKKPWVQKGAIIVGILAAASIHGLFNFLIIQSTANNPLIVFSFVWLTTIILILTLERVKIIKKF
jgi:RsiW-degrading membrane proteinase PrsW (M82 family)